MCANNQIGFSGKRMERWRCRIGKVNLQRCKKCVVISKGLLTRALLWVETDAGEIFVAGSTARADIGIGWLSALSAFERWLGSQRRWKTTLVF
jgi:hypothetical protein